MPIKIFGGLIRPYRFSYPGHPFNGRTDYKVIEDESHKSYGIEHACCGIDGKIHLTLKPEWCAPVFVGTIIYGRDDGFLRKGVECGGSLARDGSVAIVKLNGAVIDAADLLDLIDYSDNDGNFTVVGFNYPS